MTPPAPPNAPANLFICLTPLQALIARTLMQSQPGQAHDLLMVCYEQADNAKFRHYFQSTAALCRRADYVLMPERGLRRKTALPHLLRRIGRRYTAAYAASIDNPCVQYVLSRIRFHALETFDDGSGNLTPGGILYRNPQGSLKSRIVRRIKGIRYQTEDLRRLSRCHHTLFPGLPNIAEPAVPLALWPHGSPQTEAPAEMHGRAPAERRILLGQPVFDDPERNRRLSAYIARRHRIAEYFPHPRETAPADGLHRIDTPLIFEDWLIRELARQPETLFRIYHLASTAALNTHRFPRTAVTAVRPGDALFWQGSYDSLYRLMAQLGIPTDILPENSTEAA